jgi:hypothetical protein
VKDDSNKLKVNHTSISFDDMETYDSKLRGDKFKFGSLIFNQNFFEEKKMEEIYVLNPSDGVSN